MKSRTKKNHNFQRLPLFWILENDFPNFSKNRDKEFKLGATYFNFPRQELYHQLHIGYLNIRSGHEIEAAIHALS